jgi:hypothetical protein
MADGRLHSSPWWIVGVGAVALSGSLLAADLPDNKPVTFAKDIAPIFQEKCQDCHRKGSMAPMSLVTYEESRPWAKSIRQRVMTRQMPPWHIDRTVGVQKFKNDVSVGRADQHDRPLGRFRIAAGQSEGHAGRQAMAAR